MVWFPMVCLVFVCFDNGILVFYSNFIYHGSNFWSYYVWNHNEKRLVILSLYYLLTCFTRNGEIILASNDIFILSNFTSKPGLYYIPLHNHTIIPLYPLYRYKLEEKFNIIIIFKLTSFFYNRKLNILHILYV